MRFYPTSIDVGDVTLVTVTGVHVDAAQRALQRSMARLKFRRVLLISSTPARFPDRRIERIAIPPMTLGGYNRFMLTDLHRHIGTGHALIVQADGYVLNPRRWDPAWLDYDYIGAPWNPLFWWGDELYCREHTVGNGGFSLRSRKLLELTAELDAETPRSPHEAEDMTIGFFLLGALFERGIRFPSPQEAARFSIETPGFTFGQTLKTSFGFHGVHLHRKPLWQRLWRRLRRLLPAFR